MEFPQKKIQKAAIGKIYTTVQLVKTHFKFFTWNWRLICVLQKHINKYICKFESIKVKLIIGHR